VEADRLGSGATCANHGMLHSGALYARVHGHVVRHCQQAHPAFSALLSTAELPADDAVYVLPTTETTDFLAHLDTHGITHHRLTPDDVPELRRSVSATHVLIAIRERVFSSRRIIATLTAQCLAAGVTILTGNKVDRITHSVGTVTGVILGAADHVHAASVVIATGTGTPELLARIRSRHQPLLKSRLDMMVHLPAARVRRGLIVAALDHPVVMPAPDSGALASFFGGIQPEIAGRRGFPVDVTKATLLLREMNQVLTPGTVDLDYASAYVAGKTDYVGTIHAENGLVNPGCHVINHAHGDNLRGLYTVITGKMTLGFHASKNVADAILGTDMPLLIEPQKTTTIPAGLLAVEPWAPPARI
jgi:glycine/D-amino acid oxidase-like deaminating enzyme